MNSCPKSILTNSSQDDIDGVQDVSSVNVRTHTQKQTIVVHEYMYTCIIDLSKTLEKNDFC